MAEPLIKKRKIAVDGIKEQKNADKINDTLKNKEGIIAIKVDNQRGHLRVEYDLRKINFETIEKSIIEAGFELSMKKMEKLKREMAKFTEQNELDNLAAAPSSCCSDPKEKSNRTFY
ncbi:MAG: hypothetical protein GTO17_00570 [Candidatus Aminicenantes bacterium]|nr:hypothetical protein [Candidatus Aminicenantes bacterium]